MNEPQVWTMVGIFGATVFGTLGVVSGLFTQVVRAEVSKVVVSVDALGHRIDGLDKRIDGLDQRMDGLDQRMGGLERRFDAVDRDVQAIARRVFPEKE